MDFNKRNNNGENQNPGINQGRNASDFVIFMMILVLAIVMAGRKQFILNPYESTDQIPQIYIVSTPDNTNDQIHPLYSSKNYIPPALKVVPTELLFSPWFHVVIAIAFWAVTIGGTFYLIRMGGLTSYQSIVLALFVLFAGNLIIRELVNFPLLAPAPYVGYGYYSIRTPAIPLLVFGLIAIFHSRFLVSGIFIGLVTFFHIKFGFRFFGFLVISLLLWKFWGSQRLGLSKNEIAWRNIFSLVLSWGVFFIASIWDIQSSMHNFNSLNLPQSQPLISQLAWLIKNEPDDWLISYHFPFGRPLFGFLFMVLAIGAFCEIIIRESQASSLKKFAVLWEIATFVAVLFFGWGFLFETLLVDLLPLSLAHSIALIRLWDLVWVIVLGFWITLILVAVIAFQKMLNKFGEWESLGKNLIFHLAFIFFAISNIAIFVISKQGEVVQIPKWKKDKLPLFKIMDFVQICDDETPNYNKAYRKATKAFKAKNEREFQEAVSRLDTIYNKFKVKLENPSPKNPDSLLLNIMNLFANHRYSIAIKEVVNLQELKGSDSYWWSCLHSEPGIHHRSFRVSTRDYLKAAEWAKTNIPVGKGIIQPPYLGKWTLFSGHVAFWDAKIDQHMMYIAKGFYPNGLHRLRAVAGPDAWEILPGTKGKGLGPVGWWYFMDLNKESILKIHHDYPEYKYLLTENKDLQGFPVIYSNPSFNLYDILP